MSKAAKSASSAPAPADLPFEEALQKLEAIVESMEADDLPLETLLGRYEQGVQLARVCQSRLTEAEARIQQLETSANGSLQVKPVSLPDPSAD